VQACLSTVIRACLIFDAKTVRFEPVSVSREIGALSLAFRGVKAKIVNLANNEIILEPSCR
jgi:hypothetical protein